MLKAIQFKAGLLEILDQRELPSREHWVKASSTEDVAILIEGMAVRGAPAIGCAAAWGLAVDSLAYSKEHPSTQWAHYQERFELSKARLAKTRPTAVNLFYALDSMATHTHGFSKSMLIHSVAASLVGKATELEADDLKTCQAIGDFGAAIFDKKTTLLTHCNTGSLATAGYGTALGIVRSLFKQGRLQEVYVDETRPYLQGARLTAFELSYDKIPYKLISDNMAAYAMQLGKIGGVVVGADRIAANGDAANKIGTYNLAVLCKHHHIPFVVAAPMATVDPKTKHGQDIPVELRPADELRVWKGHAIAPQNCEVWNPSFDVTPGDLISAIVTETGVHKYPYGF
jgi:methylthioribose-1-phosphate isomerase